MILGCACGGLFEGFLLVAAGGTGLLAALATKFRSLFCRRGS